MNSAELHQTDAKKVRVTIVSLFFLLTLGFSSPFSISTSTKETAELERPGYALIAAPVFGSNDHIDKAKDLRNYLLDRGWIDERIFFLADSSEFYIDGNATKSGIKDTIEDIALDSTSNDLVFIAILDHAQDGEGTTYFRTGDTDNPTNISDTEFAGWVDGITNFSTMTIYIRSPYAGGFVEELEGDKRIVISDCEENQSYTEGGFSFYEALTEVNTAEDETSFSNDVDDSRDTENQHRGEHEHEHEHEQ